MPVPRSTGFPDADAQDAFLRMRRRQVLLRLAHRLRREPDDVNLILPFEEVTSALGIIGERDLGIQTIRVDSIVGTIDRARDFDRQFRPTSSRGRERWQRIAAAQYRGEPLPPISVYRVGDLHFVRDGHHRVSVAHAAKLKLIDAYVIEVRTRLPARGIRFRSDLVIKDYERLFSERVPLGRDIREKLQVSDPWSWAVLSETVEAWGFRLMQQEQQFMDRSAVALRWYEDEYRPVVTMLRAAHMIDDYSEVEAYLRVAGQRYRLIRSHEWSEQIVEQVRSAR